MPTHQSSTPGEQSKTMNRRDKDRRIGMEPDPPPCRNKSNNIPNIWAVIKSSVSRKFAWPFCTFFLLGIVSLLVPQGTSTGLLACLDDSSKKSTEVYGNDSGHSDVGGLDQGAFPDRKVVSRYPPPLNVVFAHVHMAKTAGTTINGLFASHFERVCGDKGYSLSYYQVNKRLEGVKKFDPKEFAMPSPQTIGFENCDYISLETRVGTWKNIADSVGPLELHMPCRDPIDHLLSQCNMKKKEFDCMATDLESEIQKCLFKVDRFSISLNDIPNTTMKCFNPIPLDAYFRYMSTKLQTKRVENEYFFRPSNKDRNKTSECLSFDKSLSNTVRSIMISKFPYYVWCHTCMGSKNNLLF